MHRIFQRFIEHLCDAQDQDDLGSAMAEAAEALDLSCFAYLSLPQQPDRLASLISNYPNGWTHHYLRNHYERLDPVIRHALTDPEPFKWGFSSETFSCTDQQRDFFAEAAEFGIICGFTIPIHDCRGPICAVTFAAEKRWPDFERAVTSNARVLQLMALYFHAHARRKLAPDRLVNGVILSPREHDCLKWASQGKTAWEIGQILGISKHTVATYLENAKDKLGVRTLLQAVARYNGPR